MSTVQAAAPAVSDAARQLGAILAAVESGELDATRGQRDRLRGASVALEALASAHMVEPVRL